MADIERYEVNGRRGPWRVLDRERRIAVAIAECGVAKDAEKIVRALNGYEGAVERIESLEAAVRQGAAALREARFDGEAESLERSLTTNRGR